MKHKKGGPFYLNAVVSKNKVLKIMQVGNKLRETKYEVLNLTCGHTSVITHDTLTRYETRGHSGKCVSCRNGQAAETRAKDRPVSKCTKRAANRAKRAKAPEKYSAEWANWLFNKAVPSLSLRCRRVW